jgi:hypothetical protein
MCCGQVEVSATGWSLVQRSQTSVCMCVCVCECLSVSECDRESSIMRRPWPTGAVAPLEKASRSANTCRMRQCTECLYLRPTKLEKPQLTWLYVPSWLRTQDGQVHVRFAPVNDWVRVLARPLSRGAIAHYHLNTERLVRHPHACLLHRSYDLVTETCRINCLSVRASVHRSVCELVWATKSYDGFSWNSVLADIRAVCTLHCFIATKFSSSVFFLSFFVSLSSPSFFFILPFVTSSLSFCVLYTYSSLFPSFLLF